MADKPSSDYEDDFPSERKGKIPTRPRIGTALVETSGGAMKALQYVDVGGVAVVEGDIALGTVDEVQTVTRQAREGAGGGGDGGGHHRRAVPLARTARSRTRSTRRCRTRRESPTRCSTGGTTRR